VNSIPRIAWAIIILAFASATPRRCDLVDRRRVPGLLQYLRGRALVDTDYINAARLLGATEWQIKARSSFVDMAWVFASLSRRSLRPHGVIVASSSAPSMHRPPDHRIGARGEASGMMSRYL